jgi:cytochrome bd-type quinol oxidase subunit 1
VADISNIRRAQAVGRVLWKLGNRHRTVRGGVAAAKTVSKAAVRATRILWLEVTGFFFAVFAIWVIGATWNQWEKIRSRASSAPTWHVAVGVAFSTILIYFSASSFLRARRAAATKEDSSG